MLLMCARKGRALLGGFAHTLTMPISTLRLGLTGSCSVQKKMLMISKSARTTSELTSCVAVELLRESTARTHSETKTSSENLKKNFELFQKHVAVEATGTRS